MLVPVLEGRVVLLPAHEHPEFGDPGKHYHIDFDYDTGVPRQDEVIFSDKTPTYKNRPKIRSNCAPTLNSVKLQRWLRDKYKGQSVTCGKCPHKGLPVRDGICTGHGLSFDENGVVEDDLFLTCALANEKHRIALVALEYLIEFNIVEYGYCQSIRIENASGRVIGLINMKQVSVTPGDTLKVHIT
jgi:hypothetical protein